MAQVRDFRGTDDNEWAIPNGDFDVVADAEAVPQGIRLRVGMFQGECFLDEAAGIPWLGDDNGDNALIGNGIDPLLARALIGNEIARTPDVTRVVGSRVEEAEDNSRDATVSYAVETIYSEQALVGQTRVGG